MGISLKLLILRNPSELGNTSIFASNILDFDGDYRIFSQIRNKNDEFSGEEVTGPPFVQAFPIPLHMSVNMLEEEGVETTETNPIDEERLTYTNAKELKRVKVCDDSHYQNKAVMAYVRELPDDTPIILYWC